MVKNLPVVQETWVRSLEKGTATHSMDRGALWATVQEVAKSWTRLMILKLKLQYFGHLMQRVDSLEKTLMLGGTGGRRRRG